MRIGELHPCSLTPVAKSLNVSSQVARAGSPVVRRQDFEIAKVPDQWREHPSEAMRNPSTDEWYTTAYFAGQVRAACC